MYCEGTEVKKNDKFYFNSLKAGKVKIRARLTFDHCMFAEVTSKNNNFYPLKWQWYIQEGSPWLSRRK